MAEITFYQYKKNHQSRYAVNYAKPTRDWFYDNGYHLVPYTEKQAREMGLTVVFEPESYIEECRCKISE